jgi:hypothetical protein
VDVLEQLEDMAAIRLQGMDGTGEDEFEQVVRQAVDAFFREAGVTDEQVLFVCRKLQERFNITMSMGACLDDEEYRPWLDESRGSINWYYWERYQRYLRKKKFPDQVISQMGLVTDRIVDRLGNPNGTGRLERKGLVVGDVQSGKTANYSAVICKAADAGYQVIIVLAGMLNALRNQTQIRLDEAFVGLESGRSDEPGAAARVTGVGEFNRECTPVSFTTQDQDFHKKVATQIRTGIGQLNQPMLLVLKKNKSVLRNLVDWFRDNNLDFSEFPMLLIDDEADHASVNTSAEDTEATAINAGIRELLSLFPKHCYLGYTATPFANIFIDPASEAEMIGDDLFPRDFILTIDAPSNYCGALRIFSDHADLDVLREVTDNEDTLPLRHKKNELPEALPSSLYQAINTFVLAHAIRICRGQGREHHSMMINVSRFTDMQTRIKEIVHRYIEELRDSISNHYALPQGEALSNSHMRDLFATWRDEYEGLEESWPDIQGHLKDAVSPISVIEVNGSRSAEKLDYNRKLWPNGRKVIVVGGLSLSRGITLEDLTVSYFLRNTKMYDTLLQMGRWFGYRKGYEEICRIWLTPEAQSWYAHVADALDELRYEFTRMERQGLTPRDFGLCVRSHPESLIVTARNKMRTGQKVPRRISLEGRIAETAVLNARSDILDDHRRLLSKFIEDVSLLKSDGAVDLEPLDGALASSYLWRRIPTELVKSFVQEFINHPQNQLTEQRPICDYLDMLVQEGVADCDCVLISPAGADSKLPPTRIGDFVINKQMRSIQEVSTVKGIETIELSKRRVASKGHEVAGLSREDIQRARANCEESKNYPDRIYRPYRERPLLMLHLLDVVCDGRSVADEGIVAFGLSFPGEAGNGRPRNLVEYVVNTVWWRDAYGEVLAEEDEADNE